MSIYLMVTIDTKIKHKHKNKILSNLTLIENKKLSY